MEALVASLRAGNLMTNDRLAHHCLRRAELQHKDAIISELRSQLDKYQAVFLAGVGGGMGGVGSAPGGAKGTTWIFSSCGDRHLWAQASERLV